MKLIRDVDFMRDEVRYFIFASNPKRYFTVENGMLVSHEWPEGSTATPFLTLYRAFDVDLTEAFRGDVSEDALKDARQVRDRLLTILEKRG